ncbi:hypothetical protein LOD99_893 [Oopsacas minuta]|uniref:Mos1 transposase HTH domain-containing protein n=1 Tax=Oopsacas minuta TaxID=111878 RepID=A0AAV7JZT7_9METZ|nr:hypothetical protein LOD99_893 [Oopsacas minuta]
MKPLTCGYFPASIFSDIFYYSTLKLSFIYIFYFQKLDNFVYMASKISQSKSDLTKRDFRAMVLILFKLQKTRVEIYESLQELFPDLAPSLSTVERCYRKFIHGNFVVEDAPRAG